MLKLIFLVVKGNTQDAKREADLYLVDILWAQEFYGSETHCTVPASDLPKVLIWYNQPCVIGQGWPEGTILWYNLEGRGRDDA